MREPQKVESLRFIASFEALAVSGRKATKSDKTCLLRVKFQGVFPKSLLEFPEEFSCIITVLKSHYTVSRPAELPRQSLAEPDMNLSAHPAPIIQPKEVFPSASVQKALALAGLTDQANALHSGDGLRIAYTSCVPNTQAPH